VNFAARTWWKAGFRGLFAEVLAPLLLLVPWCPARLLLESLLLSSGCNSIAAYDMEPFLFVTKPVGVLKRWICSFSAARKLPVRTWVREPHRRLSRRPQSHSQLILLTSRKM
jgi:hypothetical protein